MVVVASEWPALSTEQSLLGSKDESMCVVNDLKPLISPWDLRGTSGVRLNALQRAEPGLSPVYSVSVRERECSSTRDLEVFLFLGLSCRLLYLLSTDDA